jgi:hypothetical protein
MVGSGFYLVGALKELETLMDRLNDDKIAREAIAPALLLIQAERLSVNETTLRCFGAVASGAIGGDGYVSAARKEVGLTSGKREVALLEAAALAAHGIEAEVRGTDRKLDVVVSDDDAVKLAGLYFLFGPPLLEGDDSAADLIISEAGVAVKYNVYLRENAIELQFNSTNRGRVELAARLLRLAGVSVEVRKAEIGGRDKWYVVATTDMLAAGREELRKAIAEIVEAARSNDWVEAGKAERWLEKLMKGLTLREGWPRYEVGLVEGALVVRYETTNSGNIKQETQRFREMGLVEGDHFTVETERDSYGYVYIRREGLAYAAWLSVHGSRRQRELVAKFVEYILRRAEEAGKEVYEKAQKIIEEGMSRSSLTLKGFEKEVEVNGEKHKVKVIGGEAVEEDRDGRKLLRIKITAEVSRVEGEHTIVDRVVREYTITFSRRRADNVARASPTPAPRRREAERQTPRGSPPW